MMLNLGRYHSSLQAFQDDLAFRDGQPYGGGRQEVLALNGGYFPSIRCPEAVSATQLHVPSHPASLTHPRILHGLQINRLKAIKRQMYGRAGFELLKARVLPWDASSAA